MDETTLLRQRLAEYESLLEIGSELASTLDLAHVLELALEKAEELCGAETSSIWEVDDERGDLFFRVVRGRVAGEIRGLRVPLGAGIVGSVAASGEAALVNDVEADPRWRGDARETFHTRAILALPLVAQGRVIAVLQLLNPLDREGFDQDDLRRMSLFAGSIANAVANARLYAAQKRQFVDAVTALAEAVEKRDPYTGGHVRRVVGYSLLLGRELGLGQQELEDLFLAATLHDIGKIAIPDQILRKPAPLDADERLVMERHPIDGVEILQPIRGFRHLLTGVRSHHERIDGRGYPDGLGELDLDVLPRIIAVADTYDAMTTSRPYRAALAADVAAAEIAAGSGTQFCPRVATAFAALYGRGEISLGSANQAAAALSAAMAQG
jgi:HD-GYP domain-containing protein (c-di-GMP phosphodiesterase class II)